MAADPKVILVFSLRSRPGLKAYFRRLREAGDVRRGGIPKTEPELDDAIDQAARFSPEQAVAMRTFWREQGYSVVIEDTQARGPLFERQKAEESSSNDSRVRQFVSFTNGLGLIVTPGNSPNGPCFYVKAGDIPSFVAASKHTAVESVSGSTAQDAAQRAVDIWGQEILFPDPEAALKAEQERQKASRQASQLQTGVRTRPGSR